MLDADRPPLEDGAPPRLQLLDVFVFIGCAGLGMAAGKLILRYEHGTTATVETSAALFGMVVPTLFGALAIGHPALMLLHSATRRRSRSAMPFGEAAGLVPGASLAVLLAVLLVCWWLDSAFHISNAAGYLAFSAGLVYVLSNLAASVAAAIYLANKAISLEWGPWTDLFGAFAALLPGAIVVLTFFAAMLMA